MFFTVRDLLLLLLLTLFDDDDNNYLIAKYLLELRSVTIFLFTFSSILLFIYTWEAFPFICEVNWKKGHTGLGL